MGSEKLEELTPEDQLAHARALIKDTPGTKHEKLDKMVESLGLFYDSLPDDQKVKCNSCAITSASIVLQAHYLLGVKIEPVCRILAPKMGLKPTTLKQRVYRAGKQTVTNVTDSKKGSKSNGNDQAGQTDSKPDRGSAPAGESSSRQQETGQEPVSGSGQQESGREVGPRKDGRLKKKLQELKQEYLEYIKKHYSMPVELYPEVEDAKDAKEVCEVIVKLASNVPSTPAERNRLRFNIQALLEKL